MRGAKVDRRESETGQCPREGRFNDLVVTDGEDGLVAPIVVTIIVTISSEVSPGPR